MCPAPGTRRNLRNDLLVAADSITNTVSSLVKELHSGKSQVRPREKENWKPEVEDLSLDLFFVKTKAWREVICPCSQGKITFIANVTGLGSAGG